MRRRFLLSVGKQGILMMGRAKVWIGEHYSLKQGRLPVRLLLDIATTARQAYCWLYGNIKKDGESAPIVHGDIKPSNIVYDVKHQSNQPGRIGGYRCFAQLDSDGHYIGNNVMQLMSSRLANIECPTRRCLFYLAQSSAAVLYPAHALMNKASPVPCMHWRLASPVVLAVKLFRSTKFGLANGICHYGSTGMLADDLLLRQQAGDYFLKAMPRLHHLVTPDLPLLSTEPVLPVWISDKAQELDSCGLFIAQILFA